MLIVGQQIAIILPDGSDVKCALATSQQSKRSRLPFLSSCLGRWRTISSRHCHNSTGIFPPISQTSSHSYLFTTAPSTTHPPRSFQLYRTLPLRVGISGVRHIFCQKNSYPDPILSTETCLGNVCSSDVSRSSLVFLKREILTRKSFRLGHYQREHVGAAAPGDGRDR